MTELEPIEIPVVLSGISEVKSALKSLKDELVKLEKASAKATEEAAKKRIKSYQDEVNQLKKLHTEAARKIDSDFETSFGSGGRRFSSTSSNSLRSVRNTNSPGGFLDLTGLGKSFSSISKFATGIGVAAAGFLALKAGLEVASEALTQFGSFVISDVVKPALDLERRSVQIANSSQGQVTAKEIQETVKGALLKHNIDSNTLLEGVGEYQDLTGKAKLGFEMIDTIATIAKGRGFDAKELFSLAGSITSEGDTAKDVQEKFLRLLAQGDVGSIPLKSIAKLGGKLSAVSASLVGDDKSKIAMSAALLQTAKPKVGSEDEAMTALQSFTRESLVAGKRFGKGMISKDVSGVKQIADPAALLEAIYLKTSGNKDKLKTYGYTDTSQTFIGAYSEIYMKKFAEEKAAGKDEKEARKVAAKEVGDFVRNLAKANTTIEAEAKKESDVRKTPAEQLEDGMNIIKVEIAKAMPEIVKSISLFVKMAPQLGKAGRTLAELFVNLMNAMTPLFRLLGLLDDQGPTKTTVYALDENGNVTNKVLDPMQVEGAKYTKGLGLNNVEPIQMDQVKNFSTSEGVPYMIAADVTNEKQNNVTNEASTINSMPGVIKLNEQSERLAKAFSKAADAAEDANRKKPLSDR